MSNKNLLIEKELKSFDLNLPVEEASMPPASWYTSGDIYELEKRELFSKTWQPVARAEEISQNNSYITGRLADLPWVITRDEQGELKAFFNICPHKGREIVRGQGEAKNSQLVCGYHAWKFYLDGRLKSAPQIGGIKNFCPESVKLKPMQVTEWGHWIFINGDLEASPLEKELGALTQMLESREWEGFKFHSVKTWEIQCNWKVVVDNYLDGGYHIPHMHPTLSAQLDMSSYETTLYPKFSVQTSRPTIDQSGEKLDYDPCQRIGEGSIYAWVYPNFMINLYGPCIDSNYVLPLGESRCLVVYEFYFKERDDNAKSFIEQSMIQSDVTQKEDIEICESVQIGLNSGFYKPGRYAPKLEAGEHHFHKILAETYERGVLREET